jgi:hypothetical protein
LTSDSVEDSNPQVAYDSNGELLIVWFHGEDIMMATDLALSDQHAVLELDEEKSGVEEFRLATGLNGQIAITWQEAGIDHADVWCATYDPGKHVWSKPKQLTDDDPMEHSLAPAYDAGGNVAIGYNKVQIEYETRIINVSGEDIVVDNVPVPGQSDLYVLQHVISGDLSVSPEDIESVPGNPAAGMIATLSARIRNLGDKPAENVETAFYDGDPYSGGTIIDSALHPGVLVGGDSALVSVGWTVPVSTEAHDIFVVVDPDLVQDDCNRANNTASVGVMLPDLTVPSLSSKAVGLHNVITVRVANEGTVRAANVDVALHGVDELGPVLGTASIPEILPGRYYDVSFKWADVPEGRQTCCAIVDEGDNIEEFNENNNCCCAGLTEGDIDGDGMTDRWEDRNGFDKTDPTDAGEDADGDNSTNYEEFVAGTDPRDPASVFAITNIERHESSSMTVSITWNSVEGKYYAVYYSDDEYGSSMDWTVAEDMIIASGTGENTWTDNGTMTTPDPQEVSERYYKVEVYPN